VKVRWVERIVIGRRRMKVVHYGVVKRERMSGLEVVFVAAERSCNHRYGDMVFLYESDFREREVREVDEFPLFVYEKALRGGR